MGFGTRLDVAGFEQFWTKKLSMHWMVDTLHWAQKSTIAWNRNKQSFPYHIIDSTRRRRRCSSFGRRNFQCIKWCTYPTELRKVWLLVNRNKLNPLDCLSSFRSFKLQLVLMLFWKRKTEHELLSHQLICLINISSTQMIIFYFQSQYVSSSDLGKLFGKVSLPENVSDTIWNPRPIFLDPSNTVSNARDPDKSPLRLFLELFCINHRYKDEGTTKLLVNSGIYTNLCWIKWPIFWWKTKNDCCSILWRWPLRNKMRQLFSKVWI